MNADKAAADKAAADKAAADKAAADKATADKAAADKAAADKAAADKAAADKAAAKKPTSKLFRNPIKSDETVLGEIIISKRTKQSIPLQQDTNQEIIENIFNLVDSNNNDILEKEELMYSYIESFLARKNQNLVYDLNEDGIVDAKDSLTMYRLYSSLIPGLRLQFEIVE